MERIRSTSTSYNSVIEPRLLVVGASGGTSAGSADECRIACRKLVADAERNKIRLSKAIEDQNKLIMVDRITPGYSKIVRENKFRPINPMNQRISSPPSLALTGMIKLISNPASIRWRTWGQDFIVHPFEYYTSASMTRNIASSEDINALAIEAQADLKSAGMDYLTSIAEMRELVGMFTGLKGRLTDRIAATSTAWNRDLIQRRRSGRFRGFSSMKEAWNSFSAFWLEYRFGWRILYFDIMAINDYLSEKANGIRLYTRRKGASFDETSSTLESVVKYGQYGSFEIWRKTSYTEEVRVGYSAYVDPSVLGNPVVLNTLWDIIPFSLVVDMFFNVQSNILANSTLTQNASGVPGSGFITRRQYSDCTFPIVYVPGSTSMQETTLILNQDGVNLNQSYSRATLGSPSVDVSFQPNLNVGKLIDLATLILPISRVIKGFLK